MRYALTALTALFLAAAREPNEHTSDALAAVRDESGSGAKQRQTDDTLFRGWPKPKLALVLTGEQLGYIEPCGCSGLENQKGGLRRRYTLLKQLRGKGWPVVAMDNGGLINRFGRESEIKFEKTVEALATEAPQGMGYAAIGFGTADLKLPAGAITAVLAGFEAPEKNPFISANVGVLGFDGGLTRRFAVVKAGGMKLGITSVLGDGYRKQINNDDISFLAAKEGLSRAYQELSAQRCDRLVLLAHAGPKESAELAGQFPAFGVVVTAGGADEPPHEPTTLNGGKTLLIEVGHKGMYAIVLGFYDDKKTPIRYQRVPIDKRFTDAPEMDKIMDAFQAQLRDEEWSRLVRRAAHHGGKFAGSRKCAECHQKEFDLWRNTPHADATVTLTKVKPPRQFDPECVSCHVTGWNPQEYFPYTTGFDSLKTTPDLAGNGCENCHGPAAAHVAAEMNGGDRALREKLRLSIADGKKA
ncbi:MAG TPA: multiheme c-type cytochrome, partial [Pirellulales bacterium]|nr:multiheme c-type cytochrome [Pirellulales bacterium]